MQTIAANTAIVNPNKKEALAFVSSESYQIQTPFQKKNCRLLFFKGSFFIKISFG